MDDVKERELAALRTESAKLRAEAGAQRNLTNYQQNPQAGQWQYIALPDGSYQQFPAGMSDVEIKASLAKAYPDLMAGPSTFTKTAPASPQPQVTPEQVLVEENRPFLQGLQAGANESLAGVGGMSKEGAMNKIMGLLKLINTPAVGAGGAIGTGVQNTLAQIPGLGGAAGVIPAGGAALADAATQLLAGPKIFKGAIQGGKEVIKGAGKILSPGLVNEVGQAAAMKTLGAAPTAIERVFEAPKSKALYTLAENSGPVPTPAIAKELQGVFFREAGMSNPNNTALQYISNLERKFGSNPQLSYGQVIEEAQALKKLADKHLYGASGDPSLGQSLMKAREIVLDQLDRINPALRMANRAYRQEQATIDIAQALRNSSPGMALDKLIEKSPDVAKAFSQQQIKEVAHIAKELNSVASGKPVGEFKQVIAPFAEGLAKILGANTSLGRAAIGQALKETGNRLPDALNKVILAWKAGENIKEGRVSNR